MHLGSNCSCKPAAPPSEQVFIQQSNGQNHHNGRFQYLNHQVHLLGGHRQAVIDFLLAVLEIGVAVVQQALAAVQLLLLLGKLGLLASQLFFTAGAETTMVYFIASRSSSVWEVFSSIGCSSFARLRCLC